MIPSYEQVGDWLEEISAGFPDAFFDQLDGGIQLEEEALPDPEFPLGEMYIMGEYCHDLLGRYIVLYYGSFAALLAEEDEETWKDESLPLWPTSLPTTWRRPPGSTLWTIRTRSSFAGPGRSMAARSEGSAGRPCLFHTKNEAAVPWGQQPHLLWIYGRAVSPCPSSSPARRARRPEYRRAWRLLDTMRATAPSSPTTMNRLLARVMAV